VHHFLHSASPIHADKTSCRFAVRLYAGGANVVSNKPSAETENEKQDYYVLSLQERVDGFHGANNHHVKQFVAMPLGSGYSVEHQVTGTDLGGIQLQIGPRMKYDVNFHKIGPGRFKLALTQTPRELGLCLGQAIRMTEEKGAIPLVPWSWGCATIESDGLDIWTCWTRALCQRFRACDSGTGFGSFLTMGELKFVSILAIFGTPDADRRIFRVASSILRPVSVMSMLIMIGSFDI
jgi:hypothetical protein